MSEWQPIETAPSASDDPARMILVTGGHLGQNIDVRLADGEWWRMRIAEGSKTQFTHWMPLPEPPKEN